MNRGDAAAGIFRGDERVRSRPARGGAPQVRTWPTPRPTSTAIHSGSSGGFETSWSRCQSAASTCRASTSRTRRRCWTRTSGPPRGTVPRRRVAATPLTWIFRGGGVAANARGRRADIPRGGGTTAARIFRGDGNQRRGGTRWRSLPRPTRTVRRRGGAATPRFGTRWARSACASSWTRRAARRRATAASAARSMGNGTTRASSRSCRCGPRSDTSRASRRA